MYGFKLVSIRFYRFDNIGAFLKSCLLLPYDCATTVAPECIDRASEGLKRKSKQNYFEKVHLFCERIHFSKEVSNLQQTCSINVCTQKPFVIFKDMYCTSCNQTLLIL